MSKFSAKDLQTCLVTCAFAVSPGFARERPSAALIRTIIRYYADPAQPNVSDVRIADLL